MDLFFLHSFFFENPNADIEALPGVVEIHDVHVWSIKSGVIYCTAHIVIDVHTMKEGCDILEQASKTCASHNIDHACIQVSLLFFGSCCCWEVSISILDMITFILGKTKIENFTVMPYLLTRMSYTTFSLSPKIEKPNNCPTNICY